MNERVIPTAPIREAFGKIYEEKREKNAAEAVANGLPWLSADIVARRVIPEPEPIIRGLFHKGERMMITGGSKTFKSWQLLALSIATATGGEWLGMRVAEAMPVLHVDLELKSYYLQQRLITISRKMGTDPPKGLNLWPMVDQPTPDPLAMAEIIKASGQRFGLTAIDPLYKFNLGDENAAGDVGEMLGRLAAIARASGSSLAYNHHHSKGNKADVDPLDRGSGSGVFARDPDVLIDIVRHTEENCFVITPTLRHHPGRDPFAVEWDGGVFRRRDDLDPGELKRPGGRAPTNKTPTREALKDAGSMTHNELFEAQADSGGTTSKGTFSKIVKALENEGVLTVSVEGRSKRYHWKI